MLNSLIKSYVQWNWRFPLFRKLNLSCIFYSIYVFKFDSKSTTKPGGWMLDGCLATRCWIQLFFWCAVRCISMLKLWLLFSLEWWLSELKLFGRICFDHAIWFIMLFSWRLTPLVISSGDDDDDDDDRTDVRWNISISSRFYLCLHRTFGVYKNVFGLVNWM